MSTFIDLFAGCGGLSLGLMNAGWSGVFAIERDGLAFETLKHNLIYGNTRLSYRWPEWLPKEAIDIRRFIREHKKQIARLNGSIDLIVGGPPCQGFSVLGRRKGNDPRNNLFRHYIEVVKLVRPKLLLIENVKGISVEFGKTKRVSAKIKTKKPKPFSERIREGLAEIGYIVYPDLVKAVDYGVPQHRPRYLMIGVNSEILEKHKLSKSDFPDPFSQLHRYRNDFLIAKGLPVHKPVSVKQAISDLETEGKKIIDCVDSKKFMQIEYRGPRTAYQKLMHGNLNGTAPNSLRLAQHREHIVRRFSLIQESCRPGISLSDEDRERLGLNKHCLTLLDKDAPSHTLTTLPDDLLHYSEPRILTVRESARLQSFPDWFEFKGKYTTGGDRRTKECPRYTQVGNAVPPLLAEAIGKVIMDLLRRTERIPRANGK